jgi:CDP-diacylglycerol--glycerol-3-phosphate 3-phosphatidyltransferase
MTRRDPWPVRLLTAGTSLRIVLTPVVMGLVLMGGRDADSAATAATALFCLAAATDYVDGWLARRLRATSKLGSFLDTTADKLLVSGALIALLSVDRVSPWIAALIIGRELVILGLRGVVAAEGTMMQPSMLGKWKAAVQFVAIALAILRPGDPVGGLYIDEWAMLMAAAVTLVSAIDYITRFASTLSTPSASR